GDGRNSSQAPQSQQSDWGGIDIWEQNSDALRFGKEDLLKAPREQRGPDENPPIFQLLGQVFEDDVSRPLARSRNDRFGHRRRAELHFSLELLEEHFIP